MSADIAKQLLPLQLQLTKLSAVSELRQSKDVGEAIQSNADFSNPKTAIEVVTAIAKEAKAEKACYELLSSGWRE